MNINYEVCLKCNAPIVERIKGYELLTPLQRGSNFCLKHAEEWISLQAHTEQTLLNDFIQPERSKREDFSQYLDHILKGFQPKFTITPEIQKKLDMIEEKMRCSELQRKPGEVD